MASGSATRCDMCGGIEFNQGDQERIRDPWPPAGWFIVSVSPADRLAFVETVHLCSTACLLIHARRADGRMPS